MIPAETAGGSSFRGAALYYLHDKRLAGEDERLTSERVAWTYICNLPTDDPERAWRMMAHTAIAQGALKAAAGIKATGRKLTKPVAAYSLSWHPDEQPTREEMLAAALASLQALGVADHQAIIICHTDEPHRHVHVLLNRVHGETGLAAKLGNSRLKLSAWALAYEEGRGRIFCHERAANDARRKGQRPGEAVKRCRRMSRPEYEATAGRRRSEEAARIHAEHVERFGDQGASERYQGRRRADEADRFYRVRNEVRAAIGARHAAVVSLSPEAAATAERIALILAGSQPELVLAELTRSRSTFTRADMARLVARHTQTADQFQAVMVRLESAPDIVRLGEDDAGRDRFTTRAQQAIEQQMERNARTLHATQRNGGDVVPRWTGKRLSRDQEAALRHVLDARSLAAVTGFAGSGKSTMLDAARQSWERAGCRVTGMALSGIAADGLKNGAGIDSRTIQSRLYQWERGENKLTARDVLVVDEAGMIGSRQMERILAHAVAAGAKVVLVGEATQLQAIEAGGAFKAITDRLGAARLTTVRRQRNAWQQDATRDLATGRAGEALRRYEEAGMVHAHRTQADAMAATVDAWHQAGRDRPGDSQMILAYTKADVRALNALARAKLRADDALGPDHVMPTEAGPRSFAVRDRVYFLKNDRGLGVRNGTLGTIERVAGKTMTVRLDGEQVRLVTFSMADYGHVDHGYAATIHKSQGVTVDRAHLLASRNLDRHAVYVAMTRHRDRLDLHWSAEAIGSRDRLERIVSREALKDTSLDYGEAVLTAHARKEAADDLHHRIETRASRFADREKTAAGRLANARSLAGKEAGHIAVARLALDAPARQRLFRQQQASLQARAAMAHAKAVGVKPAGQGERGDRRAELIAFDNETARLAAAMRQRFAADRRHERVNRATLQALAARNWRNARVEAQAALEAERPFVGSPERKPTGIDAPRPRGLSKPTLC